MINLNNFPYNNMRPSQEVVLNKLKNNWDNFQYFILQIPTGGGKSAIAKTILSSYDKGFLITATKQLQDQYSNDFRDGSIKSIKGKNNYKCIYGENATCDTGPCMVNRGILKDCMDNNQCPYYNARNNALKANIALSSYQYFLNAWEYDNLWQSRDVIIIDECHLLEQQLTQWASTFVCARTLHTNYNIFKDIPLDKFVLLSVPPENSGYKNNKQWLFSIFDLISNKRKELYNQMETVLKGKSQYDLNVDELEYLMEINKSYNDIDNIYSKLNLFFESKDKHQWVVEPQGEGLILQPINIGNLFHKYIKPWSNKKIIFMSATILDIAGFCSEVGLPKNSTAFIDIESEFPPENSPIIYRPVGKMNYNNIDNTMPYIIKEIESILKMHPNEKGVIHTGSYKITNAIAQGINSNRLIIKDNTNSNETLIKRHANSKKPTVLISPSLTTGADFKDDLGRFQIIVKLPWLSLSDKRVKNKIKYNENWYPIEMLRTLIQASGRSTRSKNDWSTTYILDTSFYYWIVKYRKYIPKQFLKRIKWE